MSDTANTVIVRGVTPSIAAANPAHPDHPRWVKEKTFAMEAAHAKKLGLSSADAERENARLLERMEARHREAKPEPIIVTPNASSRHEERIARRAAEGVQVRTPKPHELKATVPSPCGRCGTCRGCMRERRVLAICKLGLKGDATMLTLAWQLSLATNAANARRGPFTDLGRRAAERKLIRLVEDICDSTMRTLGEWR